MQDTIVVFTSESKSELLNRGGSGEWTANINKLSSVKYLLCTYNDKKQAYHSSDDQLDRGQAFYIGRIKQIHAVEGNKKFIEVSEYAILPNNESYKNAWSKLGGIRNPVAYLSIDEIQENLELALDDLEWNKAVPTQEYASRNKVNEKAEDQLEKNEVGFSSMLLPDLISEARKKIAEVAKVPMENVTIKIEF